MLHRNAKHHRWLITLLMVVCVALMGQALLLDLHHHHHGPDDTSAKQCWACFSGPLVALGVAAILVAHTTPEPILPPPNSRPPVPFRVLRRHVRGPPVLN